MSQSKVLKYVFIGTADSASPANAKWLQTEGITHIINCVSDEVPNAFEGATAKESDDDEAEKPTKEEAAAGAGFKVAYLNFELEDTHDSDIAGCFDDVFEFIQGVKDKDGKVLIQCTDAKRISPTLCAAWMLHASAATGKHLPLKKALEFVNGCRIGSMPDKNANFLAALIDLEVKLYPDVKQSMFVQRPGGGGAGKSGRGRGGRGGKGKRGK